VRVGVEEEEVEVDDNDYLNFVNYPGFHALIDDHSPAPDLPLNHNRLGLSLPYSIVAMIWTNSRLYTEGSWTALIHDDYSIHISSP